MDDPTYTTLELLKESLISGGGIKDMRDSLLLEKIQSASRSIDDYSGRRFWADEDATARVVNPRGRTRTGPDGDRLLVDDIATTDDLTVELGSTSTGWMDVTDQVEAEPTDAAAKREPITSILLAGQRWDRSPRVRITARWGWPAVPQPIREATLIQALRLYKRKDSPEGVLGSAEWGTVRVSRLDPDVAALIARYTLDGFG